MARKGRGRSFYYLTPKGVVLAAVCVRENNTARVKQVKGGQWRVARHNGNTRPPEGWLDYMVGRIAERVSGAPVGLKGGGTRPREGAEGWHEGEPPRTATWRRTVRPYTWPGPLAQRDGSPATDGPEAGPVDAAALVETPPAP